MILTSPPPFNVDVIVSNVASTADAAAVFVIDVLSATNAISSFLVMALSSAVDSAGHTPPLRAQDFRKCDDSQPEKSERMPIRQPGVTQKAQRRAVRARRRLIF
jgi:hypothetical protein